MEDDEAILRLVRIVLQRESFIVEGVKTGAAAIDLLSAVAYELVIIDLNLPQVSGDKVLGYLEEAKPKTLRRVIVTTASPQLLSSRFLEKICRLLLKPFDVEQLVLYARECTVNDEEAA